MDANFTITTISSSIIKSQSDMKYQYVLFCHETFYFSVQKMTLSKTVRIFISLKLFHATF